MARGSTFQRGGSWYYRIDLPRRDGGRRELRKGGFPTRAAAADALDEVRARFRIGGYTGLDRFTTVAEFAESWLAAIAGDVTAKTLDGYRLQVERRIVPEIGDMRLSDVSPPILKRLYATYRATPRTALYVHQTCSRMLGDATRWGTIPVNPAAVGHVAPAYAPDERSAWTAGQLAEFLDSIADRRDAPLWWFAAMTGLRRGEVLGLRWGDIDLDGGTVRVRRAVKQAGGTGRTKTGTDRTMALDADTVAVVREWRRRCLEDALAWGWKVTDGDPVWVWETGDPLRPDWMTKTFPKVIPAGLPKITLHGLRHSYVTLGAQAGVHPKVMQGRAGHRDIRVTLETYTHVVDADDRAAAETIAARVRDAR